MIKNIIPYNEELAKALSGIPWKSLNETYRSYSVVEKIILRKIKLKGIREDFVIDFVENVLNSLSRLKLRYIPLNEISKSNDIV